jgi:hypothetical protein
MNSGTNISSSLSFVTISRTPCGQDGQAIVVAASYYRQVGQALR